MAKTIFEKGASAGEMRAKNPEDFNPNFGGRLRYHIDGEIYIFSTARRTFTVSQTLFPATELLGCLNGERCVLATTVADPVPQASPDLERGGHRVDYEDGWRAAIGLLHPEHPMGGNGDWWTGAEQATMSDGVNLIAQGLFPSRTNPPKEEDIKRAEGFRNKRYKRLTDMAFAAARTSSRKLADFLHQHEDVHDAMDALKLKADWHQSASQAIAQCPNCGSEIASGVAYHVIDGKDCIIDPARAHKAGRITKEQLEEFLTAPAV